MIYDNIKNICESHGTTITSVAKAVGLSTSVPNAWKNGRVPRVDQLQLYANYLNVPVSNFYDDSSSGFLQAFSDFNLTPAECDLIRDYRSDPTFRAAVDALHQALVPKKEESSI